MIMNPYIWYVSSCKTCTRILNRIENIHRFTLQDIKKNPITADQLDFLKEFSGSYEILFSKRARKFQGSELKNQELSEKDYKEWMLKEYTFLKRPVIYFNSKLHVGSTPRQIEDIITFVNS